MKVLLDCDITIGVPRKDVDDGLALLYLLGSEDVNLLGLCTTFGNSDIHTVTQTARSFLKELGQDSRIPVYKGAADTSDRHSAAAEAMVDLVNQYPGEITLLGIGSLTNFLGARALDPHFFEKVHRIILMGGLVEPLMINGLPMNELNFSSDPEAALAVLSSPAPTTVITGNLCLQALFSMSLYRDMALHMSASPESSKTAQFIYEKTSPWLNYIGSRYKNQGFHNWDAVAAVYLDTPDLFRNRSLPFCAQLADLGSGMIVGNGQAETELNVPTEITDITGFNLRLIERWSRITIPWA